MPAPSQCAAAACVAVNEICDGIDNDCDGLIDNADSSMTACPSNGNYCATPVCNGTN
jgi:hypothetical protein